MLFLRGAEGGAGRRDGATANKQLHLHLSECCAAAYLDGLVVVGRMLAPPPHPRRAEERSDKATLHFWGGAVLGGVISDPVQRVGHVEIGYLDAVDGLLCRF